MRHANKVEFSQSNIISYDQIMAEHFTSNFMRPNYDGTFYYKKTL